MAGCSSGCCSGPSKRDTGSCTPPNDTQAAEIPVPVEQVASSDNHPSITTDPENASSDSTRDGVTSLDKDRSGPSQVKDSPISTGEKQAGGCKSGCCARNSLENQPLAERVGSGSEIASSSVAAWNSPVQPAIPPADDSSDTVCCVGATGQTPDPSKSCCSPRETEHGGLPGAQPSMDENGASGVDLNTEPGTTKAGCCESQGLPPRPKACQAACCGEKPPASPGSISSDGVETKTRPGPRPDSQPGVGCAKGCCETPRPANLSSGVGGGGGCCPGPKAGEEPSRCCEDKTKIQDFGAYSAAAIPPSSCPDSCCGADDDEDDEKAAVVPEITAVEDTTTTTSSSSSSSRSGDDLEKGPASWEHAVLAVQGMTCTGCETKLQRTLAALPGLRDVRTSLVLARAEFRLDPSTTGSVADVVAYLRRTTGFDCSVVSEGGHRVEVVRGRGTEDLLPVLLQLLGKDDDGKKKNKCPPGILDISVVDADTLAISYDVSLVGARDLVSRSFGRELQLAPMRADPSIAAGSKHVRYMLLMTLLSAALTIPVLVLAWAPLPSGDDRDLIYGSVSLALATVIQVIVAGPFYPAALKALIFARVVEMDLLIVLSTSAAYAFSVIAFALDAAGKPLGDGGGGESHQFFETSTLLVTLIVLGRFVSALARQKAVESISIRSLQISTALLVVEGGSTTTTTATKEIDARLLQYGDSFRVNPDSRIPTDGIIIDGVSEVDESMITGESVPVAKRCGDGVVAGSVNGSGALTARVTRLPGSNTIAAIANMVDEAKLSKPRVQDVADRVAGYFVPVVAFLAAVTFAVWMGVGVGIRGRDGSDAAVNATTYAIAVLIVSCPCAIGLAVPMVVVIAGGVAADRGVVFKTAETLETARRACHVVFDKTGTLTEGKLAVAREEMVGGDGERVRSAILSLLNGIKHPVSVAIVAYLREKKVEEVSARNVKSLPAKGVEGTVDGMAIKAGNVNWLGLESHPAVQVLSSTIFCVTVDGHLRAVYALQDSMRPEALSVVSALQARNIAVSLLSGDDPAPVEAAARQLGIPASHVRSRCTPASKASYVRSLVNMSTGCSNPPTSSPSSSLPWPLGKTGNKNKTRRRPYYATSKTPTVIFIGDGTNDAPALAAASIGVHMADGGTDLARSAADAVLVRPDLRGLLVLLDVSAAAWRRVVFNFAWAFVYNLLAVLLAAGAFVRARIPPAYAGLGEIVSVLPVVAVAVGLRWRRFGGR